MSTSEGDSSSDNTPKRKKGVRNDAKYKNNVRIKSRLLGEKYISQKRIKKTAKKITSGQNKQKENFSISKYSYLTYESETAGYVLAREFIEGLCVSKFRLSKDTARPPLPNQKAYQGKVPIKADKLVHVAKVVKFIPDEHKWFYQQFQEWPSTNNQYDSE